jgi:hypothetical protein
MTELTEPRRRVLIKVAVGKREREAFFKLARAEDQRLAVLVRRLLWERIRARGLDVGMAEPGAEERAQCGLFEED